MAIYISLNFRCITHIILHLSIYHYLIAQCHFIARDKRCVIQPLSVIAIELIVGRSIIRYVKSCTLVLHNLLRRIAHIGDDTPYEIRHLCRVGMP